MYLGEAPGDSRSSPLSKLGARMRISGTLSSLSLRLKCLVRCTLLACSTALYFGIHVQAVCTRMLLLDIYRITIIGTANILAILYYCAYQTKTLLLRDYLFSVFISWLTKFWSNFGKNMETYMPMEWDNIQQFC